MKREKKQPLRQKRKVIVFLVDGPTELYFLKNQVSALYDMIDPSIEVFFPPMLEGVKVKPKKEEGEDVEVVEDSLEEEEEVEEIDRHWGDFTSRLDVYPGNIVRSMNELYFDRFLDAKKLYPKDITEIIHIIDMDGAYSPDEQIVEGENPLGINKLYYDKDKIITSTVDKTIRRNKRKRDNIDKLLTFPAVLINGKHRPYSIYFFSSNLDHFAQDDANIIEGKDKVAKAIDFASQYEDDPEGFVKAVEAIPGALNDMNYEESWDFITERNSNSLERHTNINILFRKILEEAKDNKGEDDDD